MEEESGPSPQPSDKSIEDTTDVSCEKDPSSTQVQTLAESIDIIRLGTQAVELESEQLESSSKKPEELVLHENIRDLNNLGLRIVSLLEPSNNHTSIPEHVPWPVQSALLRAMYDISTHRHVGAALMQYVEALRLRNDLNKSWENQRLQERLENIVSNLKEIALFELENLENSNILHGSLFSAQKNVFQSIVESRDLYSDPQIIPGLSFKMTFQDIARQLFSTDAVEVEEDQIKSPVEKLLSISTILFSIMQDSIIDPKARTWSRMRVGMEVWLHGIIKLIRELQSTCKQPEKHEVQKAIREVLLHTIGLIEVSELLEREASVKRLNSKEEKVKIMPAEWTSLKDALKKESMSYQVVTARATDTSMTKRLEREGSVKRMPAERTSIKDVFNRAYTSVMPLETDTLMTSRIKRSTSLPVTGVGGGVGPCTSMIHYAPRSPSPPVSRKYTATSVVGGIAAGAIAGPAGVLAGSAFAGIGALGRLEATSEAGQGTPPWWRRWSPFAGEVKSWVKPAVTSGTYTPVECVATPYSDPLYLKGDGSSSRSGGGGGGGGDDGGGGGGDDEGGDGGGDRGGEGSRTPGPDLTAEYNRRYLDACRSLTDAINDLCRITSQINGIQNDCREMLSTLQIHAAMMQCGQPNSALSYPECVEELLNLREPMSLLNNDQPMVRIEYFRNLRYVISVICKSLDLAGQCVYFLTLLEEDQNAAKVGVVDVKQLKKLVEEAQFTCYKMLQLNPGEVRAEALQLWRQTDELTEALAEASKRTLNMEERIEDIRSNVRQSAISLSVTLENLLLDSQESPSPDIIQLLNTIKRVGALTEDPDIVPIAANTNMEARERRYDVLKNANNLKERATILVNIAMAQENLGDDSRSLTWYTGSDVVREFEELLVAVRKNGRSAGYIEYQLPEASADIPASIEPVSSSN